MKSFAFLAAVAAAAVAAVPASAATLVKLQGSDAVTVIQNTDPGLVLQTKTLNSNFKFDFTKVDQTKTIKLFDLFTNETSVNSDDLASSPIHVGFDFTSPSIKSVTVDGETKGQRFLFGAIQDGSVNWNGSETVTFANGSEVLVKLNDATFNTGFFGLRPGQKAGADIVASFTLLQGPTSGVPEPATWAMMLTGFGGLGAAMRKRRRAGLATA
jgi:hypothetical protein